MTDNLESWQLIERIACLDDENARLSAPECHLEDDAVLAAMTGTDYLKENVSQHIPNKEVESQAPTH